MTGFVSIMYGLTCFGLATFSFWVATKNNNTPMAIWGILMFGLGVLEFHLGGLI
jgi:hypothetical protein